MRPGEVRTSEASIEHIGSVPCVTGTRCGRAAPPSLIPVSGFYEWKRDVTPKQPYYTHPGDDGLSTHDNLRTEIALAMLCTVQA